MKTPPVTTARAKFKAVRRFAEILGMRWYHIAIPAVLSLIISATDALGLGLLAPLAQGVASGNFQQAATGIPFIDSVIHQVLAGVQEERESVAQVFFFMAGSILVLNGISTLLMYSNAVFGRYLQGYYKYCLHTAIYDRYFQFGKLYFDRISQGYSKRLLEYATRIGDLVKVSQDSLISVARAVAYVGVMAWLSWRMLIFVILIFPIVYVVSRGIMRQVKQRWEESKQVSLELGRESFNIFSAMPLVWSYGQEQASQQKYAQMNTTLRQAELRAHSLAEFTGIVPRLFTLVVLLVIVGFISRAIATDPGQDITRYIVFLYVASQTLPLFKVFTNSWSAIAEMSPPVREIMRLFSDKQKHTVDSGEQHFLGLQQAIDFKHLTFRYDDRPLLDDVTFRVDRGSFVALVGPTGAGKSTVMSLLMRFYNCPPGTILLDGVDIREFTLASVRDQIAYVDQEAVVLNDTLRANIMYGRPVASDSKISQAIKLAQLEDTVSRLPRGLDTNVGDRGVQLSGGERQRVALARALAKGSDIILLDEATSALDSITEQRVQQAIHEVLRGKTSIVVAHRLSTIQEADYVVYMDSGRVIEQGTLATMLDKRGKFYDQWRAQSFA